jgi:hypothetical protein
MSPEQAGATAALARLRGEIASDRRAMTRRCADLEEAKRRLDRAPADPAALALEAWAIHGWYTALESLLERVARQLDSEVPTGDRWHRELLAQASVEVPGVRPAVVPAELRADLGELLAARHFLRHAYGLELDPAKLAAQAARLRAVSAPLERSLDVFDDFLTKAVHATAAGGSP